MQKRELELIEELIDTKIRRALTAAAFAIDESATQEKAMELVLPIETRLEQLRNQLLRT